MSLEGVENITLPSFDPDLRALDEAGLRLDVRQAVAHGFRSTLLALNTGLSPQEMQRCVEVAVDEAGDQLEVGIDMPLDSLALAHEVVAGAERAGATHVLLGLPQGLAVNSDDDVYAALSPLASGTGLQVILPVGEIGLPPRIGGGVPWGAWARMAGLDSVRGIHITTWMPQVAFQALRMFSQRLRVGIGTPLLLGALPLLHREYGVSWLSPAHWELWQSPEHPYVVEQLAHVVAGRDQAALDVHWRLAPARGIAFGAGLLDEPLDGMPHWPMAKYVSWSVGGNGGGMREPALRLKSHQLEARRAMLQSIGIEPPADDAGFMAGRANAAVS